MPNKISASEAIYGFCEWLAGRKKVTILSSYHAYASVYEDIGLFCRVNGLPLPRDGYVDDFVHPEEGIGIIPGDVNKKEIASKASIPGDEEALDYAGG